MVITKVNNYNRLRIFMRKFILFKLKWLFCAQFNGLFWADLYDVKMSIWKAYLRLKDG